MKRCVLLFSPVQTSEVIRLIRGFPPHCLAFSFSFTCTLPLPLPLLSHSLSLRDKLETQAKLRTLPSRSNFGETNFLDLFFPNNSAARLLCQTYETFDFLHTSQESRPSSFLQLIPFPSFRLTLFPFPPFLIVSLLSPLFRTEIVEDYVNQGKRKKASEKDDLPVSHFRRSLYQSSRVSCA